MKVIEATCGTERMIECHITLDSNNYFVEIEKIPYKQNQQVYGLGYYEEKALRNALKKVKDKEIVKQIKKQFRL